MKRAPILHPFLLGAYLVLHLVAVNPGQAYLDHAFRSFVLIQAATLGLLWILNRLVASREKAGLLTSLVLAAVFANGALRDAATRWSSGWVLERHFGLVLCLELLVVGVLALLITRPSVSGTLLNRVLNVFAGVLVLLPPVNLVLRAVGGESSVLSTAVEEKVLEPGVRLRARRSPPDIYYVVLDGHARSDTLRTIYGYDDSRFASFLRERGFFVAQRSCSNYISTRLLVPAVLNFQYIDALAEELGRDLGDGTLLRDAVRGSRVVTALRRVGYRVVSISSGEDDYAPSGADDRISLEASLPRLSAFESALLGMTPFPRLADRLLAGTRLSPNELHRRRVEYAIDRLGAQGDVEGPKLVFAHVFCPHNPFVFGPHGERRGLSFRLFAEHSEAQLRRLMRGYGDQTMYLHGLITKAITRILDRSKRPPVIILQGDHGLRLFLKRRPDDTCLRESFSILNALYLPDAAGVELHDRISPVNTFRVVFDSYFGTDLGLLDDEAYFSHRFGIYDFVDVTEDVETCSTISEIPSLEQENSPF